MGCHMLLQFVIYYFALKCTKMWDLSRCHCRGVCYHTTCYLCPRRLGGGGWGPSAKPQDKHVTARQDPPTHFHASVQDVLTSGRNSSLPPLKPVKPYSLCLGLAWWSANTFCETCLRSSGNINLPLGWSMSMLITWQELILSIYLLSRPRNPLSIGTELIHLHVPSTWHHADETVGMSATAVPQTPRENHIL